MSNTNKKGLVPDLRFPEFENSDSWNNEPLEDVYEFQVTNSLSRDKLNYNAGTVKNIHYGDIHTKFSTLFDIEKELVPYINATEPLGKIKKDCYCIEGDMVFADASEDLDDVGKSIEVVNLNNEKLVAGLHTLLARQKEAKLLVGFGGYLFKSNRLREQIKKEAQGAKVLGISVGRMSKIEVAYPLDKKEQQKIADCLSSLDDLITAHTQKHQALQSYKKGLLQNLFPAEGETVPALRFPEFEDAGDWEEKLIVEIGEVVTGNTPSTSNRDYYGGNIMFASPADISERRFVSKTSKTLSSEGLAIARKIPAHSILFVCIGSTIGKVAQNAYECATNQQINVIIPFDEYENSFVYYALDFHSSEIAKLAGKQAVPIINKTLFSSSVLIVPPEKSEQQKIADCLSSVDDLIATQSQKIEELKAHKKGLIQKLFLSVDEVGA